MIFKRLNYLVFMVIIISTSFIQSQSMNDLQKMKMEYEEIKKQQKQGGLKTGKDAYSNMPSYGVNPQIIRINPYNIKSSTDSLSSVSRHFGYKFFTLRDTVPFWENLPTPANYLLGPGDELILSLWGETQLRNKYVIDRDGNIYDEKVGILNLMGKSIEDANLYLRDQFSRIYSTLKPSSPSTFINLSLGNLRSINVSFVGNVNFPGIHPIHPFSDVIIKGDLPDKIQLRDKDIIFVPNRFSTIKIDSSIVRPGIYESKEGETVGDLINYAGGFRPTTSNKISMHRIIPRSERKESALTTLNTYLDISLIDEVLVLNGDVIMPLSIVPSINKVEIIGQVKKPGSFNFFEGMMLKHLVELGGGFQDLTFRKSVYMNSAEIVRRDPSTKFEKIINVNLNDLYKENGPGEIKIQNLDRFVVRSNYNFFKKLNIKISGEVSIPGDYPLMYDNETLKSLIYRSGGLTKNALNDGISIFRKKELSSKFTAEKNDKNLFNNNKNQTNNVEKNPKWIRVAWQNQEVILMPGDSIIIKRSPGTVNISGEVYNPGLIEYQNGKSLKYYIESAGGVTGKGNKKNVIVIYANGVVSPKKFLNNPKIRDGATIIVNKKEEEKNINLMEFTTNTLSIISTTVTVLVLSRQLGANQ